ncbi:hypothetical protein D3C80_440760 [compost metagenome]
MQPFGSRKFEKRLIDRKRLNEGRKLHHHLPHLTANAYIFLHIGAYDDSVGAEFQRLEHRHCRSDAADAGDVAGGGYDTALAAADNHRLVGKLRIVAFFDRRIKSVAVDMRQCQIVKLTMIDKPGRSAFAATARLRLLLGKAVATEAQNYVGRRGHVRNKD